MIAFARRAAVAAESSRGRTIADTRPVALSIVIPSHGRADLTGRCIASLWRQRDAATLEFVVVDDGGSIATADRWPATRVVRRAHRGGFAAAVNAGLAVATGERVLVLNNDTVAAPGFVAALQAGLTAAGPSAVIGPTSNRVKGAQHDPDHVGDACPVALAASAARWSTAPELFDVPNLSGLALLATRATFASIGGFDERFGLGYWEDDDFCLRARLRGHRLAIAPRAFLFHENSATFRALGDDVAARIRRGAAIFRDKWKDDPAGRIWLRAAAADSLPDAAELAAAWARWPDWVDADWLEGRRLLAAHRPAAAALHLQRFLDACPDHRLAGFALRVARAAAEATASGRAG